MAGGVRRRAVPRVGSKDKAAIAARGSVKQSESDANSLLSTLSFHQGDESQPGLKL